MKVKSRTRAYVIETTGLFFWLNSLDDDSYAMRIGRIMHKDAITEVEAREKLGEKLLRLLESNGILRPFLIVVLDNGTVEIHKDSVLEEKEVS